MYVIIHRAVCRLQVPPGFDLLLFLGIGVVGLDELVCFFFLPAGPRVCLWLFDSNLTGFNPARAA